MTASEPAATRSCRGDSVSATSPSPRGTTFTLVLSVIVGTGCSSRCHHGRRMGVAKLATSRRPAATARAASLSTSRNRSRAPSSVSSKA
ncbi:MAG: hypothetical protein U0325_09400 [Polyangiales bacterium]